MSYYKIMPRNSYQVIRKCPTCGTKTNYVNTDHFRVNANGRHVDVWMIYQCEKCKHTLNLTIYERVSPDAIPAKKYERFLANDKELAMEYGNDMSLFAKNRAEIAMEAAGYQIEKIEDRKDGRIHIVNPFERKVRMDKVLSEILGISRSQISKQMKEGQIKVDQNYVGREAVVRLDERRLSSSLQIGIA